MLTYVLIPIRQRCHHLQWNGKMYQFLCLPFGLTSAPRVYSKVMKPVVETLRCSYGHLLDYTYTNLDNMLILQQVKEDLVHFTPLVDQMLKALGLVVNQTKSLLVTQQTIDS